MNKELLRNPEPAEGGRIDEEKNPEATAAEPAPSLAVQRLRRIITGLHAEDPRLSGFAKMTKEVLSRSGGIPLASSQIEFLEEWSKQWDELQVIIDAHLPEKSNAIMERHGKEIREKIRRGETGHRLKGRQEILSDMETIREQCKEEQRALYVANRDEARRICKRVAEIVRNKADRILENEKWAHEVWSVPFQSPSAIVVHLRKCENFVISMTHADNNMMSPKAIFPYLPF